VVVLFEHMPRVDGKQKNTNTHRSRAYPTTYMCDAFENSIYKNARVYRTRVDEVYIINLVEHTHTHTHRGRRRRAY